MSAESLSLLDDAASGGASLPSAAARPLLESGGACCAAEHGGAAHAHAPAHGADGGPLPASSPAAPAARRAQLDEASIAAFRAAAGAGAGAGAGDAAAPAHRVVQLRDVLEPDAASAEVEWVGTSGAKVTLLGGLRAWPALRALRLRSNLIGSTAGLRAALPALEELELYDNQLRELEDFAPHGAPRLALLDVAYNKLRSLDGLAGAPLPALRALLAAGNRLRGGFPGDALRGAAGSLVRLDLGANGLTDVRGLRALAALEELWLGKNRLAALDAAELAPLRRLRILDVQSNRLARAPALPPLPALEELYLAHNGIAVLDADALRACPALKTLDVTANPLRCLRAAGAARALTDLWAGYTAVPALADALDGLRALPALRTLYLEHTPVARDWEYRLAVARALPQLTQLDADAIQRA
jgi:protein phosphatase 1 regulatory subunit 7